MHLRRRGGASGLRQAYGRFGSESRPRAALRVYMPDPVGEGWYTFNVCVVFYMR